MNRRWKYLKYFIVALLLLASIQPALAFDSKFIVKIDTPYATFCQASFENPVLDFTILTLKPDTLKAVSLVNKGTADEQDQIFNLTLWQDTGPVGFQGFGLDKELGNFKYFNTLKNWYFDNLDVRITDSQRFFVTVQTYSYLSESATIQFQIPKLLDSNGNGSFDLTDQGIFMDSGNNGPTDFDITNANLQVVNHTAEDNQGPKINIYNLQDGQLINNDHYRIEGFSRDQCGSYVKDAVIYIDDQELAMTNFYQGSFNYDWQNISDGEHTVRVEAHDGRDNLGQSDKITVTVINQTLNLSASGVSANKNSIKADGLDKAVITVSLKDINLKPIANRKIDLEAGEVITSDFHHDTDANGQAIFEIRSTVAGSKTLIFKTDGQVLGSVNLDVLLNPNDIINGDLIKASSPTVYYYGADRKRYVFPSAGVYFSWYSDFKNVKVISDERLAAITIGGNVTYRPGTKLVKIQSDPKVYALEQGGVLRWLKTEAIAIELFGELWAKKVADVPVSSFVDYKMGQEISYADAYNRQFSADINEDKGL